MHLRLARTKIASRHLILLGLRFAEVTSSVEHAWQHRPQRAVRPLAVCKLGQPLCSVIADVQCTRPGCRDSLVHVLLRRIEAPQRVVGVSVEQQQDVVVRLAFLTELPSPHVSDLGVMEADVVSRRSAAIMPHFLLKGIDEARDARIGIKVVAMFGEPQVHSYRPRSRVLGPRAMQDPVQDLKVLPNQWSSGNHHWQS